MAGGRGVLPDDRVHRPGADTWSGTVDYGDGATAPLDIANKQFTLAHTYKAEGTYTVSVTVRDDDGNPATHTFQVTAVFNSPPTVATDKTAVAFRKGQTATNTGTFADEQGNGTVSFTASLGTVTRNAAAGTWSWSGPTAGLTLGDRTVTITATDTGGLTATTTFTLTVNPADTAVTISAPTITYGAAASVTVTVSSALGTPAGSVSLTVDGSGSETHALVGGKWTFSVSGLLAGDHALVADYAAQGDYAAGRGAATLTVNRAPLTLKGNTLSMLFDGPAGRDRDADRGGGRGWDHRLLVVLPGGQHVQPGRDVRRRRHPVRPEQQAGQLRDHEHERQADDQPERDGDRRVHGHARVLGQREGPGHDPGRGQDGGRQDPGQLAGGHLPAAVRASAGANNLTNKSNADVLKLFMRLFNTPVNAMKLDAQIMAVALAVYATTELRRRD